MRIRPGDCDAREGMDGELLTAAQTAAALNFVNEISGSTRMLAHGLLYVGKGNLEWTQQQIDEHEPDSWKGYDISNAAKVDDDPQSTNSSAGNSGLFFRDREDVDQFAGHPIQHERQAALVHVHEELSQLPVHRAVDEHGLVGGIVVPNVVGYFLVVPAPDSFVLTRLS